MTQVDMADSHGLDHSRLTTLVGYAASRAAIELRKDFARHLGPLGLKVVDYSILMLVASNSEVNQKQLGEALDISA
ncbi:MAG TPA: MarR family transcriptional regulator, partial [Piscinibacter sp.]|nr:MarR family transcriptional regulator [Piscinibacter sp.]